VVVGVHEAGHDDVASHVQQLRAAVARGLGVGRRQVGRGTHPGDGAALQHDGAVADLAALRVHRDDDVGVAQHDHRRGGRVHGHAALRLRVAAGAGRGSRDAGPGFGACPAVA